MDSPGIVGMLRIRNEARWIRAVVSSILPVCEHVVILDDHSEDETAGICGAFPERVTVLPSPFEGLDESRDKNYLLKEVMKLDPKWCLCIDGDEILDPAAPEVIRSELAEPRAACYSLKVVFLWDAPDTMRTDGVYGRFFRPSLFRARPGPAFLETTYGGHFHCGNVPAGMGCTAQPLDTRILHLGYMSREDRLRKYRWYNETDPGNEAEDCYRHMVQGDLPEVPAKAKLMHAGPLTLARLDRIQP